MRPDRPTSQKIEEALCDHNLAPNDVLASHKYSINDGISPELSLSLDSRVMFSNTLCVQTPCVMSYHCSILNDGKSVTLHKSIMTLQPS